MGYTYYGNYAQYFEVGRVEALRSLGLSYKKFEENGIHMPVLRLECTYIKPARYDDLITIRTTIKEVPGVRIHFFYEVFNEENVLLTVGQTTLVFVDAVKNKPMKCPEILLDKLIPYFDNI